MLYTYSCYDIVNESFLKGLKETMQNKRRLLAFTLAEVLITLGIIGVVAALTIPILINSYQENQYNAGVKEAYSILQNALKMVLTNNNGNVNVGNGVGASFANDFRDDFASVINYTKKDTCVNIMPNDGVNIQYKWYKGNFASALWPVGIEANTSCLVLNNSMTVRFYSSNSCNNYGLNGCGQIEVDINGQSTPNMYGKDLYEFMITKDSVNNYKILPFGAPGDTYSPLPGGCTSGSSNFDTSVGCAAKRLMNPDNMP